MKVTQLHHELPMASHVSIVVSLLPKSCGLLRGSLASQTFGKRQLRVVDSVSQPSSWRLTQKQVNMLWHHHVSVDAESVALSDSFQGAFEGGAGLGAFEIWLSAIATESEEVKLTRLVEAL